MLACWQTCGYFNIVSNIVNKKMEKKNFFWSSPKTLTIDLIGGLSFYSLSGRQKKEVRGQKVGYKDIR